MSSKKNWNEYDIDTLGNIVSDYHKDVFGFRPRFEGLYSDKARLVAMAEDLDAHMDRQNETFAGREELREEGWFVAETDPQLAQHALWLAEERDRRKAEWMGDYWNEEQDGTAKFYRRVYEELTHGA